MDLRTHLFDFFIICVGALDLAGITEYLSYVKLQCALRENNSYMPDMFYSKI